MGLKLKWFRRRITFDGVPSAPERDIRRKEATAGTVIGVYRQSTHFEDYIEPVRSSYWEPPPQAIARATLRSNGTSTNSPSTNSYTSSSSNTVRARVTAPRTPPVPAPIPTGISSVSRPVSMTNVVAEADSRDKIVRTPVERLQLNVDYGTPPEPNYAAPKPPARKGVSKAKSMLNLANALEDANGRKQMPEELHMLRAPQSVEVLSDPYPRAASPAPSSPIHVVPITSVPRTTSSNSLLREDAPGPITREISTEPEYIVPLAGEKTIEEPIYDTFDDIFERVKARKPVSPGSVRSNLSARPETSSPLLNREPVEKSTEDDGVIFERVKIRHSPPPDSQRSSTTDSHSPSPSRSPSPLPQRKPVLQVTTASPNPTPTSPPQPKSILKKRAPAPPQTPVVEATSSIVEFSNEMVTTIPTPPPRSIRVTSGTPEPSPSVDPAFSAQAPQPTMAIPNGNGTDSDSDDDFNWDFVQKHRSSINQTVAAQTQIDPEVLRNAPASLRNGTTQTVPSLRNLPEPIAQPRTIRGMRNQRAVESQSQRGDVVQVPPPPPRARASDSNASETSA
uniref:Uncharacterized protein n=1 Tax=Anopheles epiroticus TaxID=199890 RepID=A0A182PYL6_9DIPT